jgi:POT family proton-dependent oligopeptide transporter
MSAPLKDDIALAAAIPMKKSDTDYLEKISEHEPDHELDGIHDGLVFPTEEERATLRRVPDTVPWSAYCEFRLFSNNIFT